jgi:hypothetical protein
MKRTLMSRQSIANPRRTTLAHLKDASELTAALAGGSGEGDSGGEGGHGGGHGADTTGGAAARPLPARTANPRRTVLTELPKKSPAAS